MNEQRQPFGVQSDILHILSVIELRLSSLRAKGCKPSDLLGSTAFLCASSVSLNLSPLQPCKGKKQLPPLEVRLGQSVAASLLRGQLTRRPICLILLLEAGWIEVISHFGR